MRVITARRARHQRFPFARARSARACCGGGGARSLARSRERGVALGSYVTRRFPPARRPLKRRARRQVQHCPGASQRCAPPSHPTCALALPVPSRPAKHLRYDVARAHQRLARLVSSSTRRPPPPPHAFVGGCDGRHRARHRMCVRGLRRAARARRAAQAVAARGSASRSMWTTRASDAGPRCTSAAQLRRPPHATTRWRAAHAAKKMHPRTRRQVEACSRAALGESAGRP